MKKIIPLPLIGHPELSWFETDKCSGVGKMLRGGSMVAAEPELGDICQ